MDFHLPDKKFRQCKTTLSYARQRPKVIVEIGTEVVERIVRLAWVYTCSRPLSSHPHTHPPQIINQLKSQHIAECILTT